MDACGGETSAALERACCARIGDKKPSPLDHAADGLQSSDEESESAIDSESALGNPLPPNREIDSTGHLKRLITNRGNMQHTNQWHTKHIALNWLLHGSKVNCAPRRKAPWVFSDEWGDRAAMAN